MAFKRPPQRRSNSQKKIQCLADRQAEAEPVTPDSDYCLWTDNYIQCGQLCGEPLQSGENHTRCTGIHG